MSEAREPASGRLGVAEYAETAGSNRANFRAVGWARVREVRGAVAWELWVGPGVPEVWDAVAWTPARGAGTVGWARVREVRAPSCGPGVRRGALSRGTRG
ncbi:hypothetical protein GCM10009804_70430 [Kribbella hippodromi]|uniref:Uncharacterized protein n=1 Tax=Kribbella hippodromi TaxID=434347 RepID=A0ABN2EEI5_9ACTN